MYVRNPSVEYRILSNFNVVKPFGFAEANSSHSTEQASAMDYIYDTAALNIV